MKERKLKFLALMLCFVLFSTTFLAGCSSDSTNNGEETDGGKITLKVLSPLIVEQPEGEVEQWIADEFMKQNPNIKIEFIGTPMNEIYAKIVTMATGGQLPDIFINSPEFYGKSNEMGIATDLSKLLSEEYIKGFDPITLNGATLDGKLMYLPWFTIPMGVLYRKDWFEEEGTTPPKTWAEFLNAAKKLTKDTNGDGEVDRWGFTMVGSKDGSGASRFLPIMRTFGAKELYKNDSGKWVTDYDTPEAIEAFEFFTGLNTKHSVVPPGAMQVSYSQAINLMASEKTAMMVTGSHSTGALLDRNPSLKGKLASIPLPKKVNRAATLGMLGYSISSKSEHKEAAMKYLKFYHKKKIALKFNKETGRLPTRIEVSNEPQIKNNPLLSGFQNAVQYAYPLPTAPFYAQVQLEAATAYQAIMTGQATPEEAAKKAAEKVRQLIKQNK